MDITPICGRYVSGPGMKHQREGRIKYSCFGTKYIALR